MIDTVTADTVDTHTSILGIIHIINFHIITFIVSYYTTLYISQQTNITYS